MLPEVTFVLGGAAAGKSVYAETLVQRSGRDKTYLASAQAFDQEMSEKIARHIARRGDGWTTIEEPLHAASALADLAKGQVCLFDCATLWLSNHLLNGSDIGAEQAALLKAVETCAADLVIVSNEVGHGIVPDNRLARQFREAQGQLNIALAAAADLVVQVTAGLPRALKGTLP